MFECNTIVQYGSYMIVAQCLNKDKGRLWCYTVIHTGGPVVAKPVALQQSNCLSVVIPLCEDIRSDQVKERRVTCAGCFSSRVGFDEDTGIYGIRFDIVNPFTNFTICFKTPRRPPANQTLGLIVCDQVYNYDVICSPGCKDSESLCSMGCISDCDNDD